MNVTIDIGNTFIKFASFKGNELIHSKRFPLEAQERYTTFLSQIEADRIAYCKVGKMPDRLADCLNQMGARCVEVSTSTPGAPLTCAYTRPEKLGTDRWAAAIGAWCLFPNRPLLIIDAGTCLTIDFVSKKGRFEGGTIAPGAMLRLKAMHLFTDALPMVKLEGSTTSIPRHTKSAMRTGVMRGLKHEIEGWVRQYALKYPDLMVLLTGGDIAAIDLQIDSNNTYDPQLVMRGLNTFIQ